jgi:hypothetical protein
MRAGRVSDLLTRTGRLIHIIAPLVFLWECYFPLRHDSILLPVTPDIAQVTLPVSYTLFS